MNQHRADFCPADQTKTSSQALNNPIQLHKSNWIHIFSHEIVSTSAFDDNVGQQSLLVAARKRVIYMTD